MSGCVHLQFISMATHTAFYYVMFGVISFVNAFVVVSVFSFFPSGIDVIININIVVVCVLLLNIYIITFVWVLMFFYVVLYV